MSKPLPSNWAGAIMHRQAGDRTMCTAATYTTKDHYFGRNLDLEYSYNETVAITPRGFPLKFRKMPTLGRHHAIIGMATISEGYPLYYDGTNEKGLSMAGLAFAGNADYKPEAPDKTNITPFELIPWILGKFETVAEVRQELRNFNLLDLAFSDAFPLAPLHWIISDRRVSIVLESVRDGLKVYDNPAGVLTNNPTFDFHSLNLNNYMHLSKNPPAQNFSSDLTFDVYSKGMGAIGLPGDLSSTSRFVKAAFTRLNSISGDTESASISQFFKILESVAQQRGCVDLGDGKYEITIYSSCCNTDRGIYYYTTYENSQITGVDMHKVDLDGAALVDYPLITGQQILMQN